MFKKILPALIVLATFTSCKNAAFNYSQNFVERERSLETNMLKTENAVEAFLAKEQYDSIVVVSSAMEKQVDEQLQKIIEEPVPDAKGGTEFKKACVDYFSFMKKIYTGYKDFGKAKTVEEREKAIGIMRNIVAEKYAVINKIKMAQAKYAKDNGFRLEK